MDKVLIDALKQKKLELKTALEDLTRKEFKYAVGNYQNSLPQQGRCIICTLKIPCSHYSSIEDMQEPMVSLPKHPLNHLLEDINIDHMNCTLPSINNQPKDFTVRFKGNSSRFSQTSSSLRRSSLPDKNKLITLEKIEIYKEEKAKKKLEKLQKIKDNEEMKKIENELSELKRLKQHKAQKNKLEKYKEVVKQKYEQAKIEQEEQAAWIRKEEEKRKIYMEIQKKKIAEFHEKKKILDSINKQRFADLQEDIIQRGRMKK
ncbi:unnamed protein product [Blepharisma stoltei]|uniref:Uncharacterized protein n=1 Tax=Blepharisma stoltei TaxID=1481888 RepID=A0AAU9IEC1_9CILI|nr:unnamed protein product [Blepharisma stoltei]